MTVEEALYLTPVMMHLSQSFIYAIVLSTVSALSITDTRQQFANLFGTPGKDALFDYVIIGGGTAGLVMATRLAEDSSISVAVVEAGGFYELDDKNISLIPGEATLYTGSDINDTQPLVDWGFATVPQAVSPIT